MNSDKLLEMALDAKHEELMRRDLEYAYENICEQEVLEAFKVLKKAEEQFKHFSCDISIEDITKELRCN